MDELDPTHQNLSPQLHRGNAEKRVNAKGSIPNFVNPKAKNIYGWLKFVIGKGVGFNWVEWDRVRDFTALEPITIKTLKKFMGLLTKKVEEIVANMLPDKFGIMVDWWSEGREHFFVIFATYPENKKCR